MKKLILNALGLFSLLSLLTGLAYPLAMTGLLQIIFPAQAQGSLLHSGARTIGSGLLAQKFTDSKYFWPRPSASDYATVPSGASNLGPTSAVLKTMVLERAAKLRLAHGLAAKAVVPADLVFASASGLDPHISPAAAFFQVERVAQSRGFTPRQKQRCVELITQLTEPPQFGLLGQARVNVLLLNLELDALK